MLPCCIDILLHVAGDQVQTGAIGIKGLKISQKFTSMGSMSLTWFSIEGKLKLYSLFSTFVPIVLRISVCRTNYRFMKPATSFPKNYLVILGFLLRVD